MDTLIPLATPLIGSRLANAVDRRWLVPLREGRLAETISARLGTPLTHCDVYAMVSPLTTLFADDSAALLQLENVLDHLWTDARTEDEPLTDIGAPSLLGRTLPLIDADLPGLQPFDVIVDEGGSREPAVVSGEVAGLIASCLDTRWLEPLRRGSLGPAVIGRIHSTMTNDDAVGMLEPLTAVLDDRSEAHRQLSEVLDQLAWVHHPPLGTAPAGRTHDRLLLVGETLPLDDHALAGLLTGGEWWDQYVQRLRTIEELGGQP